MEEVPVKHTFAVPLCMPRGTEPYVALSQIRSTIWVYVKDTLRDGINFQGRWTAVSRLGNMLVRRNACGALTL
jgi:hypothetical protein